MKTLLRRMAATGGPMGSFVKLLFTFSTTVRLENVHPLQAGIFRLEHPSERRPGLPREKQLGLLAALRLAVFRQARDHAWARSGGSCYEDRDSA